MNKQLVLIVLIALIMAAQCFDLIPAAGQKEHVVLNGFFNRGDEMIIEIMMLVCAILLIPVCRYLSKQANGSGDGGYGWGLLFYIACGSTALFWAVLLLIIYFKHV
jgi:heme/copper-type cytochrome/quinol oxidase subunit 2